MLADNAVVCQFLQKYKKIFDFSKASYHTNSIVAVQYRIIVTKCNRSVTERRILMFNFQDYANMSQYSKALGPMYDLQRIGSNMAEEVTRENLTYWSDSMSAWVKYMQTSNRMDHPESAFKINIGYWSEQNANNLEHMERLLKICGKSMRQISENVEESMEKAGAQMEHQARSQKSRKHNEE